MVRIQTKCKLDNLKCAMPRIQTKCRLGNLKCVMARIQTKCRLGNLKCVMARIQTKCRIGNLKCVMIRIYTNCKQDIYVFREEYASITLYKQATSNSYFIFFVFSLKCIFRIWISRHIQL